MNIGYLVLSILRWLLYAPVGVCANITTGGNRNETWSSRFGRGKLAGRKRYVVLAAIVDFFAWVFSGQENHCVDSINERFIGDKVL